MGLPPMFARPEARHQRQIASIRPAWGQWTDILIVAIGMVLTARYVAPFSFLFSWSILFLLFLLLPILAVSGLPPVITVLFFWLLTLHRSFSIFSGRIQLMVSHSWLIISTSFLLLAGFRAIRCEWASPAPCMEYPSSSISLLHLYLIILSYLRLTDFAVD